MTAPAPAASARTLFVAVVTPEGPAHEGPALDVVAPAFDGEVAFLPGHAPFLGLLGRGELRIRPPGAAAPLSFFLAGGVVQVQDDQVVLLAERAVPADALDPARARRDLEEALAQPAVGEAGLKVRAERVSAARAALRVAEARRPRGP